MTNEEKEIELRLAIQDEQLLLFIIPVLFEKMTEIEKVWFSKVIKLNELRIKIQELKK